MKGKNNGIYKIAIGKNSSKTLEIAGSSKVNNAKVDIWGYGNAMAQKFYFEYQDGYYKITAMHTGKSLTAKNNSIQEGTEIVQADYSGSNGQKWLLKDTKKNGWTISPLNNPSNFKKSINCCCRQKRNYQKGRQPICNQSVYLCKYYQKSRHRARYFTIKGCNNFEQRVFYDFKQTT